VKVQWDFRTIIVGSSEIMKSEGIEISESAENLLESKQLEGMTSLFVSLDRRPLGIISIADTLRQGAKEAIERSGTRAYRNWMLTGDSAPVADRIGKELGISYEANLLPKIRS